MARDGQTGNITSAITASVVRPILFLQLLLDSGTIYIHSEVGSITWGGNTYEGVGDFGTISTLSEETDLQLPNISLALSGIASEYLEEALAQEYQGRTIKIYWGFMDSNFVLIDTPCLEFEGEIDQMDFEDGATVTINLTAINELHRWETPNISRYTDVDQQVLFPGDKGLEFVNQVDREVVWGQT